ncbi:MAG: class I SAM-dependent methyltransferase [Spirochaetaceae bacterium]|jgi:SAM-dependent methyltransferase|nr:class I SAM-dependent methyltransferase [Spirochaetaceae bacterium]
MEKQNYTDFNAAVIDTWVKNGWEWGKPISHEDFVKAQNGAGKVLLTPTKYVPEEWFVPPLVGKKVLGLAAGGGQQMPVFAALGADCTVLDYSDEQLATEQFVAEREAYAITIVKADMTKKLPFQNDAFDIIFHPVSNCYVADVQHIWHESYRVLKDKGILIAGMSNGLCYLFDDIEKLPLVVVNALPYNPLNDQTLAEKAYANHDALQFSHSLEELIGGQLKAGFVLTDLYEDYDTSGILRNYAPEYIATRAIKSPVR